MNIKKKNKILMFLFLSVALILLGLVFINSAFLSAFMLWLSLFIFSLCYYIKDDNKKKLEIVLFLLGVLLIISAIIYMYMRIM